MKTLLRLGATVLLLGAVVAAGAVKPVGRRPFMGWTSWDQEALQQPGHGEAWLTAAHIRAQSDAMHRLLQRYGYNRINLDSGWASGYDMHGRPAADTVKFPGGIAAIARYVHKNGQLLGIYWIPGINADLYRINPIIAGTHITIQQICAKPLQAANGFGGYKIDFSKPGAHRYVDSIVRQWARWGVDFIKLDGIAPGSDKTDLSVDARPDVRAWAAAVAKQKRSIWLELSWAIDRRFLPDFQPYANGWRIEGDVDRYGSTLTGWQQILRRFSDAPHWVNEAGAGRGWNDLDALLVGNGREDGLNSEERRTAATLWAISAAPLYEGDDLTQLDSLGISLLTNKAVIAVDQMGHPAHPLHRGGRRQIWYANEGDGTWTAALFNLHDHSVQTITLHRKDLGLYGPVEATDLWSGKSLGVLQGPITFHLEAHACRLLGLRPLQSSVQP